MTSIGNKHSKYFDSISVLSMKLMNLDHPKQKIDTVTPKKTRKSIS